VRAGTCAIRDKTFGVDPAIVSAMEGVGVARGSGAVMVVAHVRLYRELLMRRLSAGRALEIAGQAGDRTEALMLAASLAPDVVVVDVRTPQAVEIINDLRSGTGLTRVVAVAAAGDSMKIWLAAGAVSCLTVDEVPDRVCAEVMSAARGPLPRATRAGRRTARGAGTARPLSVIRSGLTPREHQVIELIRDGLSNKAIGRCLLISDATVKNHVHHILEKLEVTTRGRAVARTAGLSAPDRASL
jgi:two-component system, NarL family, nitrate/nitrite response regulator NarL